MTGWTKLQHSTMNPGQYTTQPHPRQRERIAPDFKLLPGNRWLLCLVLSGLCLAARNSLAAELDLADLSLEQLLEVKVVSASKFEQRGRDAPSAVQVIGREEIRRHGWRTLTEALNTLPGLYASNDKAYDFQGARGFQITGDYNTRFLLLVDGQRNNDNIYQSAMTGSEGWLDMSTIERIEYIPGPGSALYGSNAMFGVINVITRQSDGTGQSELSARLSGLYGNGVNLVSSHIFQVAEQDTRVFLQYSADHKAGRDLAFSDPLGQLVRADGSVSPDGVAHGLDNGRNQHLMARVDRGEWSVRLISHERTQHPSAANYLTVFDDPSLTVFDRGTQLSASVDHALSGHSRLYARVGYSDFSYRGVYPYLDAGIGYYHNLDDVQGRVVDGELRYQWNNETQQLEIIKRSARILNTNIEEDAILEIAARSRGTPRVANRLLKRVRDFGQVQNKKSITKDVVNKSLKALEIDDKGLDSLDIRVLDVIIRNYNGGPVGIESIAIAVGEEADTIEDVCEPFLIQLGLIIRTPQGRKATDEAYKHMNIERREDSQGRLI